MLKKKRSLDKKLFNLFKKLNIRKRTKLMVHSNAAGLYQFNLLNKNKSKRIFFKNLLKTIGKKGNLIVPVYNYDFNQKKPFFVDKINCQVGELGNFFLKNFKVERTINPIFSHAMLKSKEIYKYDPADCLGKNSFFNYLHEKNFKIFGFCAPLNSMTFLHYVECCNKVRYRFNKKFSSFIIKGKKKTYFTINYYAGKKKLDCTLRSSKIEKALKKNKTFKILNFGKFFCWTVDARDVFNVITKRIKKNNNYLIK